MLGIQEFPYHVGWLEFAYRLYVLLYRGVMITLGVQMVAVLTEDVYEALSVVLLALSYSATRYTFLFIIKSCLNVPTESRI